MLWSIDGRRAWVVGIPHISANHHQARSVTILRSTGLSGRGLEIRELRRSTAILPDLISSATGANDAQTTVRFIKIHEIHILSSASHSLLHSQSGLGWKHSTRNLGRTWSIQEDAYRSHSLQSFHRWQLQRTLGVRHGHHQRGVYGFRGSFKGEPRGHSEGAMVCNLGLGCLGLVRPRTWRALC